MKTFKNLFAVTAIVALLGTMLSPVQFANASYSEELQGAYEYAYENGITTMPSIEASNIYGSLTRVAMAKMMANFSMDVLGNEADTDMECNFPDVSADLDAQYDDGVTNACQLGLMGVGVDNFNPYGLVTRAEFGTVLSRALYGDMYNGANPYYADHLDALKDAGIMSNISNPMMLEVRGYVMLMMQRGADEETTTEGCSAEELLACITADDYDDCIADCSGDDVEDEDEPAYDLDGDLTVDLDNSTPDSMKLPKGANGVEVAVFEVEADNADVDLFTASFELAGMGAASAVEDIALFTEDGRVSKAKSFNSDDVAVVTFSPALTIKKGQKVELMAVVSTKGTASVGDVFSITLTDLDTTAEDVDANYPIVANEMEIGSVTATTVTVAMDGSVSAVKVGEEEAEVLKFKITNGSTTKEDVEVTSITLKENGTIDEEDEMSNFVLWYDGEEVATAKSSDGKYITFNLDDTVLIEDGKTEKFVVTADIDGGAAKTVQLFIDKKLDVMATASKYGFVSITNNVTTALSAAVSVEAGELSIITTEPTMTEIRKDKDNLVIGELKFVANAGKDLEFDDFTVVIDVDTLPSTNDKELLTIFENVELYNASAGGIYDLTCTETSAAALSIALTDKLTCTDTDMDIALRDGSTNFEIRLDTQNVATSAAGLKFHASVDVAGDVKVIETEDDNQVTDVTPSSISYKSIEVQDSTATVTALNLSATKSAVIGSMGVVVHKFEIEAGDSSDIEIDEIKVLGTVVDNGTAGTAGFNNTRINSVKLYVDEVSSSNLLDTVAGSQIAANVATFNGFKEDIEQGAKKVFYVTVDVINDANQALDTLNVSVTSVSAEDSDNDDITVGGTPAVSTRTATIKGVGTLAVAVDNTDSATSKAKNVLGGVESDFVASYEFTSTNEAILIKELRLDETSAQALTNAVSEVVLYANDKTTELARESVSTETVKFDNLDITVAEGNQNLYVKVITDTMGKDQAGVQTADLVFKLTVKDAEGAESNKVIVYPAQTAASNAFSVLPVKVSSVAFVSSYAGVNVATTLNNGDNDIAIIAVTTDASANTDDTDGSSLKTLLTQIKLKESKLAATTVNSYTIEKVNGDASTVAGVVAGVYVTFDMTAVGLGTDDEIDNGSTSYYLVKANVTKDATTDNDDYLKVGFDALNASNVAYKSDSTAINDTVVTDLRIGITKIDGTQINE